MAEIEGGGLKVIPVALQSQLLVFLFFPISLHLFYHGRGDKSGGQPLMGHGAHGGFDVNGPPFGDKRDVGKDGYAVKARQQQDGQQQVAEPMAFFLLFRFPALGIWRRRLAPGPRGSVGLGFDYKLWDLFGLDRKSVV